MTELSREAILAMVPGNELDVLIHQRIFKSEYPSLEEMKSIAEKQWKVQPGCIHFHMGFDAWKEDGEFKWRYDAPYYSRNISSAWEVIEKQRRPFSNRQKFAKEMQYMMNYELIVADADIRKAETEIIWHMTPLNICKAALLTTLEEESR